MGTGCQILVEKVASKFWKNAMEEGWNSSMRQLGSKFFPVMGLRRPAATRDEEWVSGSTMRNGMSRLRNSKARQVPARPWPMMSHGVSGMVFGEEGADEIFVGVWFIGVVVFCVVEDVLM